MLPDHHSGVIFQRRRPTGESKVVSDPSPAYIKVRLDAHLIDKWAEGRAPRVHRKDDYHRVEIDNGLFNDKLRAGSTIQTKQDVLFGGGAGGGGDAIDGTRENGTNYSESKANRREQTGFEGGKTGISCEEDEDHRCEGDRLEKTERQRGERK